MQHNKTTIVKPKLASIQSYKLYCLAIRLLYLELLTCTIIIEYVEHHVIIKDQPVKFKTYRVKFLLRKVPLKLSFNLANPLFFTNRAFLKQQTL